MLMNYLFESELSKLGVEHRVPVLLAESLLDDGGFSQENTIIDSLQIKTCVYCLITNFILIIKSLNFAVALD